VWRRGGLLFIPGGGRQTMIACDLTQQQPTDRRRIPVAFEVAKVTANPNLDGFFADYLEITLDKVKARLAYAASLVERENPRQPADSRI
jgi:hypothetical protein